MAADSKYFGPDAASKLPFDVGENRIQNHAAPTNSSATSSRTKKASKGCAISSSGALQVKRNIHPAERMWFIRGVELRAGFESVGVVAALSTSTAAATGLAVGAPVATMTYGGFSEYALLPAKHVLRVPVCSAATVALLTSGLTASLGLEQARRLRSRCVPRPSLTLYPLPPPCPPCTSPSVAPSRSSVLIHPTRVPKNAPSESTSVARLEEVTDAPNLNPNLS